MSISKESVYTCILYDQNNMRFYEVVPTMMEINNTYEKYISASDFHLPPNAQGKKLITFVGEEIKDNITLDDTTMKRLAMYCKAKDLELTNAKIKVAEIELKQIHDKVERFKNKYDEIIKFIDNDFKSNRNDDDWDEDDWE